MISFYEEKIIHWTWNWINFIIKCLLCDTKNMKYKTIPNKARRSFQCLVSTLINRCHCFDKYLHSTRFLNVFLCKILHFCCNVSFRLFGINKQIESTQAYSVKKNRIEIQQLNLYAFGINTIIDSHNWLTGLKSPQLLQLLAQICYLWEFCVAWPVCNAHTA